MSEEHNTMQESKPRARATSVNDKLGTKRQRSEKDESCPKNKKKNKNQDSVLESPSEIQEMWESLTNTDITTNPKVVDDRAKRKEDNDEIAKLFNWRRKKPKWEKDKSEISLQVEQVMAALELAVEDDVDLNKQGKPATNKLIKLPFLVAALSKKKLQAEFLDHGVLNLLKNWLEPLPDGSLPSINIRTTILRVLEDLSIVLGKEQEFRREQLIKSGLAKVVLFLSKSDEETRVNKRLASDLVNRWGHMVYDKSTRYENMLSQEEREEQEKIILRRQNKKRGKETRVRVSDVDIDFSADIKQKVLLPGGGGVGRTIVPTAMSMDFVLRPGPKHDKKLEARAKMQVDEGRYESLMKKLKSRREPLKRSQQALKISVDGRT